VPSPDSTRSLRGPEGIHVLVEKPVAATETVKVAI
jgi:hypothetical protein